MQREFPSHASPFDLVQRLKRSPYEEFRKAHPEAKISSNPFGYGRLGDYELDYMGRGQFEFGATRDANDRLAAGDLASGTHELEGVAFDFLWIASEGEPFSEWDRWVLERGCSSLERPIELLMLLGLEEPFGEIAERCDVWWALEANVMWALRDGEDGHLPRMLESMGSAPVEFLN